MDIWIILQKYIEKASEVTEAASNLTTIVVLLCDKGKNFDKFKKKMSAEGTRVFLLKNKYGLVSKLSPDIFNEITLAWIGHC